MQIDKHLYDEINEYCKLNCLKTRDFIHKILREAFNKEKFGDTPFAFNKKNETNVEKPKNTIEKVEEKIAIPENDKKMLNLTVKILEKTVENDTSQNLTTSLPVKEIETSLKKEENLKPKKKRTLN